MSRSIIERLEKEIIELKQQIFADKKNIEMLRLKEYMLNLLIYTKIEDNKQEYDINNYVNKLLKNNQMVFKKIPESFAKQIIIKNDNLLFNEMKKINSHISQHDFDLLHNSTKSLKKSLDLNDYLNLLNKLFKHKNKQNKLLLKLV